MIFINLIKKLKIFVLSISLILVFPVFGDERTIFINDQQCVAERTLNCVKIGETKNVNADGSYESDIPWDLKSKKFKLGNNPLNYPVICNYLLSDSDAYKMIEKLPIPADKRTEAIEELRALSLMAKIKDDVENITTCVDLIQQCSFINSLQIPACKRSLSDEVDSVKKQLREDYMQALQQVKSLLLTPKPEERTGQEKPETTEPPPQ